MKKRIFGHVTQTGAKLLLSVFALLLVLTGCDFPTPTPPAGSETTGTEQPTELPTEPGTEPPAVPTMIPPGGVPTEAFQAELADAFLQSYGTIWTYRYAEGDASYYGAYDDYAVLFVADSMGKYGNRHFYCGQYKFGYHMNFVLVVYRNGEFYHLSDAYQSGIVTDAQLKTIWETQNLTNGRYVETDQRPDINALPIEEILSRIGTLSEEKVLQIKTDFISKHSNDSYEVPDLRLWYYGEFNGTIAYIMDGPWGYFDALYEEKIGGIIFSYASSRMLNIYHDGNFYGLLEAYKKGLLTVEDLEALRENYIVIQNKQVYY